MLPNRPPTRILALLLLAVLALSAAGGAAKPPGGEKQPTAQLAQKYRDWLEEVDLLITDAERKAFAELTEDYQRDAFIERFWEVRDPYPETARNELQDRWEARVAEARQRFGSLEEDRSRMLLLNGEPAGTIEARCSPDLWPLDIWIYDGTERMREGFILVFVQVYGVGKYRLWEPGDGLSELTQRSASGIGGTQILQLGQLVCPHGDEVVRAINWVLGQGMMDYTLLLAKLETPPESNGGGEWTESFAAYSTDLPADAPTFHADLHFDFPGRHQSRTVVQGVVAVPIAEAGAADLAGHRSYNFLLTGEVLLDDQLFDRFRYKFNLPAEQVTADTLPLVFERYLRPGDYRMVVKIEDLNSGKFFRDARALTVPAVADLPPPPADAESARLLAEANAAISTEENTLKLVPPRGELQTGMVRFDALATGNDIAQVTFSLDGQPVLIKNRPPWSVELDLGSLPRMRSLRATAYDASGAEVASDELAVNAGSHRFAIRLTEPRTGKRYSGSLRAKARVDVPEGGAVDRVEFYLGDQLVATLYQPPWEQPIVLPPGEPVVYVRAVAYQPDGNSTEDVVFVNAPELAERVEVQFVELYVAVLDKQHHPVEGLGQNEFRVAEDGVEQKVLRFDRVENLPIHVAVMVDVSASMKPAIDMAQRAALDFFQNVLTPRDRAALVTFNDHPNLAAKFTNDMGKLAGGLAGLNAERGTALYDSLIFTLYYFNGIRGQRAVVLLTDGKDESSRFSWDQALEYARRAGVAIYTVGLDQGDLDRDSRKKLARLAEETGGRSFLVDDAGQLPAIYETIQKELRSRYYLAYQSSNSTDADRFRAVEVRVDRPGLEAKTIRGYYP